MTLNDAQLKEIFEKRPNRRMVGDAKTMTKKLIMHMTGVGLEDYISNINSFERPGAEEIRRKYTKSNRDLFARLHRPIDRVYTAQGGSFYYNMTDTDTEKFKGILSEVNFGYSLKKWMEVLWQPTFHYDPMGMVFIEVDKSGKAYPTYKSVLDVFDYKLDGRKIEYVIFETGEKLEDKIKKSGKPNSEYQYQAKKIYRVVDDVSDRLVVWDGRTVDIIEGRSYPNYFGEVPAIINSDIYDPVRGLFVSPDADVVESADEFLREGSVKSIFKNYFGFPLAWEYGSDCPTCSGEGVLDSKTCPDCKGIGKKVKSNVWEKIIAPIPTKDDVKIAPELAGYITPDVEGWNKMDEEMKLMEEIMYWTYWGVERKVLRDRETATGRMIDTQPLVDRLNKFSHSAEYVQNFIIRILGNFYFRSSFKGANINYGKRFLIESPDVIWKKYEDARKMGASDAALNDLLSEFYHAKYQNDKIELKINLKMMAIEPFLHLTIAEVDKLRVPAADYLNKLYFNEWYSIQNRVQLFIQSKEELRESLTNYVKSKNVEFSSLINGETQQQNSVTNQN